MKAKSKVVVMRTKSGVTMSTKEIEEIRDVISDAMHDISSYIQIYNYNNGTLLGQPIEKPEFYVMPSEDGIKASRDRVDMCSRAITKLHLLSRGYRPA